jgi:hypothetical protein
VTSLQVNYTDSKVKNSGTYAFNTNGTNAEVAEGNWTTGTSYFTGNSNSGALMASASAALTTAVTQLNDAGKYLMLIPQTTTGAGDLTVKLTYTIKTGSDPAVTYPITYPIPATTYDLGKQYTYNFTLTLNPVVFDTNLTVAGWEDGTPTTDINL